MSSYFINSIYIVWDHPRSQDGKNPTTPCTTRWEFQVCRLPNSHTVRIGV